jgi:predicted CoA-binding protein
MPTEHSAIEATPELIRQRQIHDYWAADLSRRTLFVRRQRKRVLENCRRIAVVGASDDPNSPSHAGMERLLGLSLELIPIFPDRVSFLGLRCYRSLRDVPGKVDLVLVHPSGSTDWAELARAAIDRGVAAMWIEQDGLPSRETAEMLAAGRVELIVYESL